MDNFEDTTSESAQGKAQVIMSHHDESFTVGKRPRRQRSYAGRDHTGNKGKKTRKSGNKHDSNVRSGSNIPQKDTTSESAQGRTHVTMSHHDEIPTIRRPSKKRSHVARVHTKGKKTSKSGFPQKTYDIMNTCDEDLAGWINNGKMFVIKDTKRFEKEIIPRYFDATKFSSFVRQLNLYCFHKIQDEPVRKADIDISTTGHVKWFHENFQRDAPELLRYVKRPTKGAGNACNFEEQQQQINQLKEQVESYEGIVTQLISKVDLMGRKISVLTQQLSENNDHNDQSPDREERVLEPRFSKPTLHHNLKIKKELPPDNDCQILPFSSSNRRSFSSVEQNQLLDSSFLRSLSIQSNQFNEFIQDEKDSNKQELSDQSSDSGVEERVRELSITLEPTFSKPTSNSNRALSSTSFILRSLSVESNQLLESSFGDIMYNAFLLDGTEINKDEKEGVGTSSQNITIENSLERMNTEEIDQIDNL